MTIDQAIDIAWGLDRLHGEPRPSVQEALEQIEQQLAICGFNWLTGQEARRVLQEACTKPLAAIRKQGMKDLHDYALNIDGPLLVDQRRLLLKVMDAVCGGKPYVAESPRDEELLQGLMSLLDDIADQAHDRYGLDSLVKPEPDESAEGREDGNIDDPARPNQRRCECE